MNDHNCGHKSYFNLHAPWNRFRPGPYWLFVNWSEGSCIGRCERNHEYRACSSSGGVLLASEVMQKENEIKDPIFSGRTLFDLLSLEKYIRTGSRQAPRTNKPFAITNEPSLGTRPDF